MLGGREYGVAAVGSGRALSDLTSAAARQCRLQALRPFASAPFLLLPLCEAPAISSRAARRDKHLSSLVGRPGSRLRPGLPSAGKSWKGTGGGVVRALVACSPLMIASRSHRFILACASTRGMFTRIARPLPLSLDEPRRLALALKGSRYPRPQPRGRGARSRKVTGLALCGGLFHPEAAISDGASSSPTS
jgi:hypothetical protein